MANTNNQNSNPYDLSKFFNTMYGYDAKIADANANKYSIDKEMAYKNRALNADTLYKNRALGLEERKVKFNEDAANVGQKLGFLSTLLGVRKNFRSNRPEDNKTASEFVNDSFRAMNTDDPTLMGALDSLNKYMGYTPSNEFDRQTRSSNWYGIK